MDKTKLRKAFFALGGLFVVLVLIFSLVQYTQSYSVTFDTDGGNEIPAVSVNKDDTVARPQNPTKNGFTFAYWELDGEEFDFSQPITADIKLKAIWEAITYTVTFDSDGGSDVEAQVIAFGENANKPEDPIREGYSFIGWYLNEVEHDFSQVVEQDMHLLAMWEQVDDDSEPVNRNVLVGTKKSVYTFGTHRPANFLGSPQVVVTVYKDGTAVSANTVYSNGTVLGDKNNDQGLLLIDESLIDFVNRAQLANGTFVNVSKRG